MTHAEELIELLDKETIAEDAMHNEHPSSPSMQEQLSAIEETFRKFRLQGSVFHAYCAPQVNCFEFSIGPRERTSAYCDIKDCIRKNVGGNEVRMVVPVSGQNYGRIEIANSHRAVVAAGEVFRSTEWQESRATLPLMLGKGIDGEIEIADLAMAPHLLVTGCTGSGKSIFLDSCIHSLMFRYKPSELKLILADYWMDEFGKYKNLPYLQFPVIHSTRGTLRALQWLDGEIERRYKVLRDAGCRDIKSLNRQNLGSLPYVVMIIDQFSDFILEAKTQMESMFDHLCAMSRAVGIHLIISTQRSDSQVLTQSIMANFPARIAFELADSISSQIILDLNDAMSLTGIGDMLFRGPGTEEVKRIQGVYVNDKESARIIEHLKKPSALPPMNGTLPNPIDALHGKLVAIAHDFFEEYLYCLKDDAVDDACNEIAGFIIERWDLMKEIDEDEEPTGEDSDLTDSDFDAGIFDGDSKILQKAIRIVTENERPIVSYIQNRLKIGYNKALALMEKMEFSWLIRISRRLVGEDDKMLLKAMRIVVENKRPMISYIQHRLSIGYNRALALMGTMERLGIVSPRPEHGSRSVLVDTYEEAISRLPKHHPVSINAARFVRFIQSS